MANIIYYLTQNDLEVEYLSKKSLVQFMEKVKKIEKIDFAASRGIKNDIDFIPKQIYKKKLINEVVIRGVTQSPEKFKIPYALQRLTIKNTDLIQSKSLQFSGSKYLVINFDGVKFGEQIEFSKLKVMGSLNFRNCDFSGTKIGNLGTNENLEVFGPGAEICFDNCVGLSGTLDLSGYENISVKNNTDLSKVDKIIWHKIPTAQDMERMGLKDFPIEKMKITPLTKFFHSVANLILQNPEKVK